METNQIPQNNPNSALIFNTKIASEAFGTANLGNTCFANTVHKILWGYLGQDFQYNKSPKNNQVQNYFYDFIDSLNKKINILSNSPNNLSTVVHSDPYYQSALNNLFDSITTELINKGRNGIIYGSHLKVDQADAISYLDELLELTDLKSISNSFKQVTQKTLKTDIVTPPELNNEKMFFSLSTGKIKNSGKLEELLQENMKEEIPCVKSDGTIDKTIKPNLVNYYFVLDNISLPPKTVLFTVERSPSIVNPKLDKISYPETVLLTFYNSNLSKSENKKYQLKGTAIYYGGHSFAYLKTLGTWYKHNDSTVSSELYFEDYEQELLGENLLTKYRSSSTVL